MSPLHAKSHPSLATTLGQDMLALIGAKAVVLADVPRGATAVGVPARIVRIRNQVELLWELS
jgi:serine acetyltransferase